MPIKEVGIKQKAEVKTEASTNDKSASEKLNEPVDVADVQLEQKQSYHEISKEINNDIQKNHTEHRNAKSNPTPSIAHESNKNEIE